MKFVLAGEDVEVDVADLHISELFSTLSVQELIQIKKHTAYGLATLSQALKSMEPEAVMITAWVGLKRLGHGVTPDQVDFDLIKFCTELTVDGIAKDAGDEGEADPTKRSESSPNGKIQWPAEAATSEPSPTT